MTATANNDAQSIEFDSVYDLFDPVLQTDPYPYYVNLRDNHPVYYNERLNFYALSRYEDVFNAARNTKVFSSAKGLTPIENEIETLGIPPTFIMMDPPDHTRLRRLITKAFTPDTVKKLEPKIRDFVVDRVEKMKTMAADGQEIDLVAELASPLPTMVVADILGVPKEDRKEFDPWSDAIVAASADFAIDVNNAIGAMMGLMQYFGAMCKARRADPKDDMMSALIAAEVEGEKLNDFDILGFCFVMIAGGNDTTTNNLTNSMRALEDYKDQRRAMVEDPSLIGNAVEELLRYETPVQGLSRTTTQATELHGVPIPADTKVHLLYASANRDPRHWGDDVDDLNIYRKVNRHMSFTQGPHFCIGAHVARLMATTYFEEMFSRIGESYEIDWDNCERRKSAFTRGYTRMPIQINT